MQTEKQSEEINFAVMYSKIVLDKLSELVTDHNQRHEKKVTLGQAKSAFLNGGTIADGLSNVSELLKAKRGDYLVTTASVIELDGNFEISFSSNSEKIKLDLDENYEVCNLFIVEGAVSLLDKIV